jgi:hypothetical protein
LNTQTLEVLSIPLELTFSPSVSSQILSFSTTIPNNASTNLSAVVCLYGIYANDYLKMPSKAYVMFVSTPFVPQTTYVIEYEPVAMHLLNSATSKYIYDSTNTVVLTMASSNFGFLLCWGNRPRWFSQITNISLTSSNLTYMASIDGGIYVSAAYSADAVIRSSISTQTTVMPYRGTGNDVLITKYDSIGEYEWSGRITSTSVDSARGIIVDVYNNLYVCGYTTTATSTPINVYASGVLTTIAGSNENVNGYILKYSSTGTLVGYAIMQGTNSDQNYCIAFDIITNSVYCGGSTFNGSSPVFSISNFSRTTVPFSFANSGNGDAFICRLKNVGSTGTEWCSRVISTATDTTLSLDTDSAGNVYALVASTGASIQIIQSDNTSKATLTGTANITSLVLVKFTSAGLYTFYGLCKGSGINAASNSIVVVNDAIYTQIQTTASITIGIVSYGTTTISITSLSQVIFNLASNGTYNWSVKITGTTSNPVMTVPPGSTYIYLELNFSGIISVISTVSAYSIGETLSSGTVLFKITSSGVISLICRTDIV